MIPFLNINGNDNIKEGLYHEIKGKFNFWKILRKFIFNEIKHRLVQLQMLGFLPEFFDKIINLITQQYHGNVTIFPIPSIKDYTYIISNVDKPNTLLLIKSSKCLINIVLEI